MLNFRKLRQDFSSSILKEGRELHDKKSVVDAKIVLFDARHLRIASRVKGSFENVYESEIEIDRSESSAVDSNCDCTYTYDCQHIAALLYFLEENLNEMVVTYSHETDLDVHDEEVKQELLETFEEAATKEDKRQSLNFQKEVLREYVGAADQLGRSPFFLQPLVVDEDKAELAIIFSSLSCDAKDPIELQLAIRLPLRSKPLFIPHVKAFLDAIRYREPINIGGRRYFFSQSSFDPSSQEILTLLMHYARFFGSVDEKFVRMATIEREALGSLLARGYERALGAGRQVSGGSSKEAIALPALYCGNLEEPLCLSPCPAEIKFVIDYLEAPGPTLMLKPSVRLDEESVPLSSVLLFESQAPGLVYQNTFYRFQLRVRRAHLKALNSIAEMTIPEPLFGTFIENALPVLRQYAEVSNPGLVERFVTLPFVEKLKGRCEINYLNGELEAKLFFNYAGSEIPASLNQLSYADIARFSTEYGILARNLVEERKIIEEVFEDFLYDEKEGVFRVKSERKIVEFMTEVVPRNQVRICFECPENLSEQFIYDESSFTISLSESERIDTYKIELEVDGYLKGASLDLLWDCLASKKRYLELNPQGKSRAKSLARILVLDLDKIAPLIQIFDELGIAKLDSHTEERPLWSLTTIQPSLFKGLPVKFKMTSRLKQIQKQLLGGGSFDPQPVPQEIQATLRAYQMEGVHWLEKLRRMHLGGILADDMGLGKTVQAIVAITQSRAVQNPSASLIVCPTSLVYNWKEEFHKFNPRLTVAVIDGTPDKRKKALKGIRGHDIIITSYNLLQKDIEVYKEIAFNYVVLDEAQHIKNRGTRNAKSVKLIKAGHRLILTGTPIENSLEELWSLFDFLMPGLLSSYDRFVEKYIRKLTTVGPNQENLETLKKKVSPFILRRMKEDVLQDLPPVTDILYHCHLTDTQKELYQSYAASAKEELSRLVKKEGFDKIQIHVLATLTRLKQICCHPAIFAKDHPEMGDSAKYDMLMELLPSLIEGKHKTVIFSQYTKMLTIMREDLKQMGISFAYLDGSSKNRLDIVKQFNDDPNILVFLVSLKAGGAGLNLTGADTVIHYDIWWNPAVENQATDRVHRIGQKRSVSSYKLVTLNTIEEKILNLQNRKRGLVKKVISSDDEAIAKLTWEEVLELLQT